MRRTVTRTNLFLIELVVNLFIFALCAAVCVGLLLHARTLSRESTDLTGAVYAAQTAAEAFKAGTLPILSTADSPVTLLGFDRDWTITEDAPVYTLSTTLREDGAVLTADIAVASRDGAVIYTLSVTNAEGVHTP